MNTSYKVSLLVAVVLLVTIAGYYAARGGGDITGPASNDPAMAETPAHAEEHPTPIPPTPGPSPTGQADVPDHPAPPHETPEGPTVVIGPAPGEPMPPSRDLTPATHPNTAASDTAHEDAAPHASTHSPDPETAETTTATQQPGTTAGSDEGGLPATYIVQPNDNFITIAQRIYGSQAAWEAIAQANPSVDPTRLRVGQELRLPRRSAVDRAREQPPAPNPGQREQYTVQPGDNLSRIAERFYGNAQRWRVIYNQNRDAIGPDPGKLRVGMTLVIPPALPGAE